ncbi:neutral/alkaline non-lysosomal ceramidase N-terminal domain-containing protein [Pseudoalteromonas sp. OOF1S-7]|uniref:neutral/alkaline non-lysosomal ceramidase N-terminal domain-containing protein n=1 Tax=Pseudoalteromonas sp. OOF1S-7 TaxID=2917757 RepID=UPI001EF51A54|nr:neutral/alkaline non-lysosomal ceramidase N-terminal domain-containing protein [Pseudoalteromonas sp. OOF1S-7]MCG7537024.1 neutral/alkaline ceramidase [Pseudoalteromonas sp. OOF1S-7]
MTTLHARYKTWLLIVTSMILVTFSLAAKANNDWIIGSGIYDITGPAADRGMVGYGDTEETTQGIHTRLWSRAFVIGKPGSNRLVTFVSADLQSITQGVHQGVLKKISSDPMLAPFFNQTNVMLSATHVHVGPGGYDHNIMLNMSALGYDEDNYNTIVNGIYMSIRNAFLSRDLGSIRINQGQLSGAAINRNVTAYNRNPDADDYATNINETMTVLKLTRSNGQEIGMINWFGVHNVSSNQTQRLITGDNKGVAAQLFEKQKGANWPLSGQFVAAFANSEEGDVSPNVCGAEDGCAGKGNNEANVALSAQKQYNKAISLYNSASDTLNGTLDMRFQYVKLPGLGVASQYTGNGNQVLCKGAIGFSMTAGATHDGPSGQSGVFEGMTQDNEGSSWNRISVIGAVGGIYQFIKDFGTLLGLDKDVLGSRTDEACQYPKPTFLPIQLGSGAHLYTDTLPFQLFQIGNLALVGIPGEMTTMAARRLRSDLQTILAPRGITKVIFAGLANAYGGYITTKEEYQVQYYEGAHNLFGQYSLAAYRQIFAGLASALVNDQPVATGPSPLDWSNKQKVDAIGVVYDDKRVWESFGQTWNDANSSYNRGSTVKVKFRSGHPQNNFKTMSSFLEVQKYEHGIWSTILTDNDLSTKFTWIRDTAADCLACSFAQLEWTIDPATPKGVYRIKHQGHSKSAWGGQIQSYSGTSRSFLVK